MPKYEVVLFYQASAYYSVEAEDEDFAVEEAKSVASNEDEERFMERLNFNYTDYDVYQEAE